jgi:hypothetical protein
MSWKTLDVARMLSRREEATTSANVGAFERPIGPVLSRYPSSPSPHIPAEIDIDSDYYGGYQTVADWMLLPSKG